MTDDLHPDLELASRALDEDTTVDERARVQASPELTDLVEALRHTREAVAEVPVPAASGRDAAIAAALSVFDELHAPAATPAAAASAGTPGASAGRVVSLFRRRAGWVMATAAAVLLVGVLGSLALNGSGSDDSTSGATETDQEILRAGADTAAPAAEDAAGATELTDAAPPSTISSIDSPAVAGIVVNDPAALLSLADELAPLAMTSAGGAETLPMTPTPDASLPDDGGVGGNTAGTVPKNRIDCPLAPDQVVFADILWQDIPAVGVRSTTTGVVQAVSYDCIVLVTVGP